MGNRSISFVSALAVAGAMVLVPWQISGQAAKAAQPKSPSIRRMPDGRPDLQGTFDLATITPFERSPGDPPSLTKEKADQFLKAELARRAEDNGLGREQGPPKSFFDALERAGGGAVGGYNRYWLNQGTQYTVVDGQIRTSIVIERTVVFLRTTPLRASAELPGAASRLRTSVKTTTRCRSRPAPLITPSSGRWASAASWDSAPLPVRRRFQTTSTTTCIRSCRLRIRS